MSGNAKTETEPERDADGASADRNRTAPAPFRASLLWGAVGVLSFLVLVQGYELLADEPVGLGAKFVVAAVVGLAATAATRVLEPRPSPENESP